MQPVCAIGSSFLFFRMTYGRASPTPTYVRSQSVVEVGSDPDVLDDLLRQRNARSWCKVRPEREETIAYRRDPKTEELFACDHFDKHGSRFCV